MYLKTVLLPGLEDLSELGNGTLEFIYCAWRTEVGLLPILSSIYR